MFVYIKYCLLFLEICPEDNIGGRPRTGESVTAEIDNKTSTGLDNIALTNEPTISSAPIHAALLNLTTIQSDLNVSSGSELQSGIDLVSAPKPDDNIPVNPADNDSKLGLRSESQSESEYKSPSALDLESQLGTNHESQPGIEIESQSGSENESTAGPEYKSPSALDLESQLGTDHESQPVIEIESQSRSENESTAGPEYKSTSALDLESQLDPDHESQHGIEHESTAGQEYKSTSAPEHGSPLGHELLSETDQPSQLEPDHASSLQYDGSSSGLNYESSSDLDYELPLGLDHVSPAEPNYELPTIIDYKLPPQTDYELQLGLDYKLPPKSDYELPLGLDYKLPPEPDHELPLGHDDNMISEPVNQTQSEAHHNPLSRLEYGSLLVRHDGLPPQPGYEPPSGPHDMLPSASLPSQIQNTILHGYNVQVCLPGYSCEGLCGHSNTCNCSCDAHCWYFGDCCLDYEEVCLLESGVSPAQAWLAVSDGRGWDMIEHVFCTRVLVSNLESFSKVTETHMSIVSTCPKESPLSNDYNDKCTADVYTSSDLISMIPVSTYEAIFKNIYCAKCHGLDEDDVTSNEIVVNCFHVQDIKRSLENNGYDAFRTTLQFYNCLINYKMSADVSDRLKCDSGTGIGCKYKEGINQDLVDLCKRYQTPIIVHNDGVGSTKGISELIFKNSFCALCVGFKKHTCPNHIEFSGNNNVSPYTSYISLVLGRQGHIDVKIDDIAVCGPGEKRLRLSNVCKEILCPNGLLVDDIACPTGTFTLPQALEELQQVASVVIYLSTTNAKDADLMESLQQNILQFVVELYKDAIYSVQIDRSCKQMKSIIFKQPPRRDLDFAYPCCVIAPLDSARFTSIADMHNVLESYMLHNISQSVSKFNGILHMTFDIYNHDITKEVICKEGSMTVSSNVDIISIQNKHYVYIEDGQMFVESSVPIAVSWGSQGDTMFKAVLCQVPQCSMIQLARYQYEQSSNGVVVKTAYGNLVHINSTQFITSGNDSIHVCSDALSGLNVTIDEKESSNTFLPLCSNIVSILCLTATLLTYFLFPTLRTLPGLSVMSLSTALFGAQLVFLCSARFVHISNLCNAIAAVQHFLWLSVFCWSFVLNYDLSSTFSQISLSIVHIYKLKRFMVYCVIGWGSPLMVVITCLVLHVTQVVHFRYGGRSLCWINGQWSLLVAFVLPLLLLTILNLTLFVYGSFYLRISMKKGMSAKSTKSNKENLILNLMLCLIPSIIWLFGCLAHVSDTGLQWHIFIVINLIQCVYIFFTFTCSYQVRQLWKEKLGFHAK